MTATPAILTEKPGFRGDRMGGATLQGSAEHPEPLHRALERLRLEGAIFLRAEYTEGWALDSQGGPASAGMLHPAAQRVILFHVVARGRC
jgi:hypothetical protein